MTDDEINRRVAEIEGWKFMRSDSGCYAKWVPPGTHPAQNIYSLPDNPPPYAIDWAWCGPLIEKYECSLNERGGEGWVVDTRGRCGDFARTPQRAICLAVIAAHGKPTQGA